MKANHPSQESKVLQVFERHLAAFTSGNLEAMLADYTEDSVLITQDGVFVGTEGVRTVFGALLREFGNISLGDSPGFTFDVKHVYGDTLFITWHAKSKNCVFPFGTDTFISDGETIARQSISFSPVLPRQAA